MRNSRKIIEFLAESYKKTIPYTILSVILSSCASEDSALKDEVAQLRKELRDVKVELNKRDPARFPEPEPELEEYKKSQKVSNLVDVEELYSPCVHCHGDEGDGNGPTAPALNPKPRNFKSSSEKWKNGKSLKGIIKTLKEGIPPGMASYAYMREEEIEALAKYVLKLSNQK